MSPRDPHFGPKIGPDREPDCARMQVITLLFKKYYFFIGIYEGIALVANIMQNLLFTICEIPS